MTGDAQQRAGIGRLRTLVERDTISDIDKQLQVIHKQLKKWEDAQIRAFSETLALANHYASHYSPISNFRMTGMPHLLLPPKKTK